MRSPNLFEVFPAGSDDFAAMKAIELRVAFLKNTRDLCKIDLYLYSVLLSSEFISYVPSMHRPCTCRCPWSSLDIFRRKLLPISADLPRERVTISHEDATPVDLQSGTDFDVLQTF